MNLLTRCCIMVVAISMLVGCSVAADTIRKTASRDMQIIYAKRPLTATCISQQLKTIYSGSIWNYEVVEDRGKSILLQSGDIIMCIYDLEDWTGGTMVTLFESSSFGIEETKNIVNYCRKQLEFPK